MPQRTEREQSTDNNAKTSDGDRSCDSELLETIAATPELALPDELFHVIRNIVPPPPKAIHERLEFSGVNGSFLLPEKLYSRRLSEESLLMKVRNPLPSSAKQAKINLEELFYQIIEPNKYTHENDIMESVCYLMQQWPGEEAIQEQSLRCFLCLHQQRNSFLPSQAVVIKILDVMRRFPRNEMVQRNGVKVLRNRGLISQSKERIDIACIVCRSLCELPHVGDLVVYAKDIVEEMTLKERVHLRKCVPYVEMLLNFPNRTDVTIYLSWCAFDILALLAVSGDRWDELINLDGQIRLQKLSERPEFEDRCRFLLHKIVSTVNQNIVSATTLREILVQPIAQRKTITNFSKEAEVASDSLQTKIITENPVKEKVLNGQTPGHWSNAVCIAIVSPTKMLPDKKNLVSRMPQTPPSTIDQLGENYNRCFSDDKIEQGGVIPTTCYVSCFPMCSPSSSFSSESKSGSSAILAEYDGEFFSQTPSTGNGLDNNYYTFETDKKQGKTNVIQSKIVERSTCPADSKPPNGKVGSMFPCLICKEPRAIQPLLIKQLNQASHCLLQPRNKFLLKCLQSNLCQDHRV